MTKFSKFLIPIILVLFVWANADCARAMKEDSPMAPNFSLKDLSGNEVSLSDFEGKVLFLNFWATWCPPCRAEIPDFIEVYDKYKDMGLAILGISVDQMSAKRVGEFAERLKMNYPVAMATRKLFQDYPAPGAIPTTLVIDGSGKIRHKKVGMMSKQELIDLFLKLKN